MINVMDAVEQHRLAASGRLLLCLAYSTLQPGLLDPVANTWTPTSDEFNRIQHHAYNAWVDYCRQKLKEKFYV
jgi:hypothetical protein